MHQSSTTKTGQAALFKQLRTRAHGIIVDIADPAPWTAEIVPILQHPSKQSGQKNGEFRPRMPEVALCPSVGTREAWIRFRVMRQDTERRGLMQPVDRLEVPRDGRNKRDAGQLLAAVEDQRCEGGIAKTLFSPVTTSPPPSGSQPPAGRRH